MLGLAQRGRTGQAPLEKWVLLVAEKTPVACTPSPPNPDQWQRLREDPGLARVAFAEAVRWESPVQTFFRTANRDVRLGDVVVPDGRKVLMFLAAANRDPRR